MPLWTGSPAPLPLHGRNSSPPCWTLRTSFYAADPSVIDGTSARGLAQTMNIAICNSKGLDVSYESSVAGLIAMPTVSDARKWRTTSPPSWAS